MKPVRYEVTRGSARVRVLRSEWAGERPPAVLVHGIGMSHRYFERLHTALARTRTVVSVDLPGFGGLPRPDRDLSVPEAGSLLAEVVGGLHLGPAVIVGHSMGAQWAAELARQRPDLAVAVVLIGPVVDAGARTLTRQAVALAVDSLGETPATNAIVVADYLRCNPWWYVRQARHMVAYRLEDTVAQLQPRVLIVRGGRDPIAGRAWCRRLRDAATDGVLVEIPGAHHVAQRRAPRAIVSAIDAFGERETLTPRLRRGPLRGDRR